MSEVWAGRFIAVHVEGTWEYVTRTRGIGAAVILAIDAARHVLLVEQYRVPLHAWCLELPAGLVGDSEAGEAPEASAARELEEETGWRAGRLDSLGRFASSPGMVGETFELFRAHDLVQVGAGGGVDGENIIVHRVALDDLPAFVAAKRAEGRQIDVKLMALLLAGTI